MANLIILSNYYFKAPFDYECIDCEKTFEVIDGVSRPTKETFDKYLSYFLKDLPFDNCAKAGRPAYLKVRFLAISSVRLDSLNLQHFNFQAIKYNESDGNVTVEASYFMSYHTSLVKSNDFFSSLKQARIVANDVQNMLNENGHDVAFFPYRCEIYAINRNFQ